MDILDLQTALKGSGDVKEVQGKLMKIKTARYINDEVNEKKKVATSTAHT